MGIPELIRECGELGAVLVDRVDHGVPCGGCERISVIHMGQSGVGIDSIAAHDQCDGEDDADSERHRTDGLLAEPGRERRRNMHSMDLIRIKNRDTYV